MPVVEIVYAEKARGLFWTEFVDEGKLGEVLRRATSSGQTERAEAISEALRRAASTGQTERAEAIKVKLMEALGPDGP